jgi:hypothetical protein
VGVQVVQNQMNSTHFGVGASEKSFDEGDEVNFSPMVNVLAHAPLATFFTLVQ